MQGLLPIYKPTNITSYDVIRRIKKIIPKGTKIGHAGTLDPFAEGVLILMLGKATKRFAEIQTWQKTYVALATLGAKSDTLDLTGKITKSLQSTKVDLKLETVQAIANKYIGEIEQIIPNYSASKYKGKKLYEYARRGVVIPIKKKKVKIYSIKVQTTGVNSLYNSHYYDSNHSSVGFRVVCGSGTYIRQLSYDILKELGVESYLSKLVRESIGEIKVNDCLKIDELESIDWQSKLL